MGAWARERAEILRQRRRFERRRPARVALSFHGKVVAWGFLLLGLLGLADTLAALVLFSGVGGSLVCALVGGGHRLDTLGLGQVYLATGLAAALAGGVLATPSLVVGCSLLRGRPGAIAAVAVGSGVVALLSFPLGSLIGLYVIWALCFDSDAPPEHHADLRDQPTRTLDPARRATLVLGRRADASTRLRVARRSAARPTSRQRHRSAAALPAAALRAPVIARPAPGREHHPSAGPVLSRDRDHDRSGHRSDGPHLGPEDQIPRSVRADRRPQVVRSTR